MNPIEVKAKMEVSYGLSHIGGSMFGNSSSLFKS